MTDREPSLHDTDPERSPPCLPITDQSTAPMPPTVASPLLLQSDVLEVIELMLDAGDPTYPNEMGGIKVIRDLAEVLKLLEMAPTCSGCGNPATKLSPRRGVDVFICDGCRSLCGDDAATGVTILEVPQLVLALRGQHADALAMNTRLIGERDAYNESGMRAQADVRRLEGGLDRCDRQAKEWYAQTMRVGQERDAARQQAETAQAAVVILQDDMADMKLKADALIREMSYEIARLKGHP